MLSRQKISKHNLPMRKRNTKNCVKNKTQIVTNKMFPQMTQTTAVPKTLKRFDHILETLNYQSFRTNQNFLVKLI